MVLRYLIAGCVFLILVHTASANAGPAGFLEGHLNIVSPKTVELADGKSSTVTAETYAQYPLVIRSRGEKKEVTRVTADKNGNCRVELPAGDYVLDMVGRTIGHVRAKPQPFTVVSKQTVHVNMDMDTGIR